jgi:DNA-binding response OmpR family regulator
MKVTLWMLDRPIRGLIQSFLIENGYDVSLVNDQSLNFEEAEALKYFRLLIIEMDVIVNQAHNTIPLLEKLRELNNCKVLILSRREYYPIIRNNKLKVDQLADHIINFPVDKYELLANVERYLKK